MFRECPVDDPGEPGKVGQRQAANAVEIGGKLVAFELHQTTIADPARSLDSGAG